MKKRWFNHQHVIFDCDSTLSSIEGIDELAHKAGVRSQVKVMTDAAMAGDINLQEVYGERLKLIQPTAGDIFELKQKYLDSMVKDAKQVIETLLEAGHEIYIVSGGLLEPVREFGISLGINEKNIFAVGVGYDQLSGQWWQSGNWQQWSAQYLNHHQSPLTLSAGKQDIIKGILADKSGRSILIGDGVSDLLAADNVDQFIGYGGIVAREKVKNNSEVFINCESLLPIIALAGSQPLIKLLLSTKPQLATQIQILLEQQVSFTDINLKTTLLSYFHHP